MGFSNDFAMTSTLARVSGDQNGAYARLSESMKQLIGGLLPYFKALGTPENDTDRLIGHIGIQGEINNSLGMVFVTHIKNGISEENEDVRHARLIYGAIALSTAFEKPSEGSRFMKIDETKEQAFDRSITEIGKWLNDNSGKIRPDDLNKMNEALITMEYSILEIKTLSDDVKDYLTQHIHDAAQVAARAFPERAKRQFQMR